MKAVDITSKPPGGERTPIAELVPLDTPLVVQIFPVYACNFSCKYCTMSIPGEERGFISDKISLDTQLFKKCIDDMKQFPRKIKVLRFVGMGEPLLHPSIASMIKYASEAEIFERIELLTNGFWLTPGMSASLVTAGLTHLLVSIQGTSAEKYLEISQVDINFDVLLKNLKYLYERRGNTKVHIKIADCALEDDMDKLRFYNLFGDKCDTIGIERIGPIHKGVKFNKELATDKINQYGAPSAKLNICSQPFYTMQVNPDGNVVPCYSIEYPDIIGNCKNESLVDIWNGEVFRQFRYDMLGGIQDVSKECIACTIFKHRAYAGDDLSSKIEELKEFYS